MSEKVESKSNNQASMGVESLIKRLRNEGVEAGQTESEKIISEARQQAALIKQKAQQEAEEIEKIAREEYGMAKKKEKVYRIVPKEKK